MLRPDGAAEQRFRRTLRAWIERNLPPDLSGLTARPTPPEVMPWYRRLARRGWIAPHWPRAYGGMQAKPIEQLILLEELARAGAPELPVAGVNHIGPLLIRCGSAEQRARHLPKILSGEVVWAQGYSEPEAGSDLLGLRTQAVVDGRELVITGQKTWTTFAQYAQWMFALVRCGAGPSRRNGITFVLLQLEAPGVTLRPLRSLAGDTELCEVFLDHVRVPIENVVGEIGAGWQVATALLNEERIRSSNPFLALTALARLKVVVSAVGTGDDPRVLDRIARAEVEVHALEAVYLDALTRLDAGELGAGESSLVKLLATETAQGVLDALQEIAGARGAVEAGPTAGAGCPDFSRMFMQGRKLSIYGGTSEIQRSILAAQVLGLRQARGA